MDFDVDLPENDEIQVSITGVCIGIGEPASISNGLVEVASTGQRMDQATTQRTSHTSGSSEDMMFHMEMAADRQQQQQQQQLGASVGGASDTTSVTSGGGGHSPNRPPTSASISSMKGTPRHGTRHDKRPKYHVRPWQQRGIELTPMPFVPGGRIEQYLGHLNFFLIRESTSVRMEGGLNGFMQSFVADVMAICRAHVTALGGNALVSYQLSECVLDDNMHKNQSQCLVNVYGDVVEIAYDAAAGDAQTQPAAGSTGRKITGISPLLAEAKRSSPQHTTKTSPLSKRRSTSLHPTIDEVP